MEPLQTGPAGGTQNGGAPAPNGGQPNGAAPAKKQGGRQKKGLTSGKATSAPPKRLAMGGPPPRAATFQLLLSGALSGAVADARVTPAGLLLAALPVSVPLAHSPTPP